MAAGAIDERQRDVPSSRPSLERWSAVRRGHECPPAGRRDQRVSEHESPAEHEKWVDSGLFVGRTQALDRLHELIEGGARLLTILGPEGIGKSRVAYRYAAAHEPRYAREGGGAFLCDLADAASVDEVTQRVAATLDTDLSGAPGVDPSLSLAGVLDEKSPLLLVLDNADRVTTPLAPLLELWLQHAPEAVFLVTGRSGLGLEREVRVKLGPLRVPAKSARHLDEISGLEAVSLFVERARDAVRGWTLKREDAAAVAEIVRRVGGVPLAIEIAAARLAAFSPAELLERLPSRVELLKREERPRARVDANARRTPSSGTSSSSVNRGNGKRVGRSTLTSTIEWSWRLLKPWEQAALAQSAVFRGGFTAEAAEAVLDLADFPDAPPVVFALKGLKDKSLLRRGSSHLSIGRSRLTHYAPIRDFAEDQLHRSGHLVRMRNRHAAYFLEVGRALAEEVDTHGGVLRRRQLEQEAENLMAVVRTSLAADPLTLLDVERALRGLLALEPVLATRGPFQVHLMLLDMALEPAEVLNIDPLLHARALESRGRVRRVRAMLEQSLADLERALELARAADSDLWQARALGNIGTHHLFTGELEQAEARYAEALPLMREQGARLLEGRCTSFIAGLHRRRGDLKSARECYELAIEIHREVGDRRYEGITVGELAVLLLGIGKERSGVTLLERALQIHREVGNRRFEGLLLNELARVRFEQERYRDCAALCEEAIRIHREVLDRRAEGHARARLGDAQLHLRRHDDARVQYDLAATLQQNAGDTADAAISLAKCACVEATQGSKTLARETLRDAEELAAQIPTTDIGTRQALKLYRAHVLDEKEARGERRHAAFEDDDEEESTMPDGRIGAGGKRQGAAASDALRSAARTLSALRTSSA